MEAIMTSVSERADRGRFELDFEGGTAFASYRLDGDRVVLTHTEVPEAFSGRGIGSRLAQGIFAIVRDSDRKIVIRCSFIAAWARRHPEYSDLVVS
jgi:predicted GNAT family acetyltransferase